VGVEQGLLDDVGRVDVGPAARVEAGEEMEVRAEPDRVRVIRRIHATEPGAGDPCVWSPALVWSRTRPLVVN